MDKYPFVPKVGILKIEELLGPYLQMSKLPFEVEKLMALKSPRVSFVIESCEQEEFCGWNMEFHFQEENI